MMTIPSGHEIEAVFQRFNADAMSEHSGRVLSLKEAVVDTDIPSFVMHMMNEPTEDRLADVLTSLTIGIYLGMLVIESRGSNEHGSSLGIAGTT